MITRELREYAAEIGVLPLGSDDERRYDQAVERYAADGDRVAYMTSLMALGVAADCIRWHLARPGRQRAVLQQ